MNTLSRACVAYRNQGNPTYPGHDNLQNGVLEYGKPITIYCSKWYEGQPGSGYFTDKATIDSCTNDVGSLDSNKLGSALQTQASDYNYYTNGNNYEQKPVVTAYDIDWKKFAELKNTNPDLYNRLSGGDSSGIKCAFGPVEANPQYGKGEGNQYYIGTHDDLDPSKPLKQSTFNQAVAAGIFKENPDKSFSESKGNLVRHPISDEKGSYTKATNAVIAAVEGYEKTLDKKTDSEIDSQVAKKTGGQYVAAPDQRYGYDNRASAGRYAEVVDVEVRTVEEPPPLLHDLTSLQIEASRRYGMTAAETLACVQHLYEEGDATYPRTDSHYITSDMSNTVALLLSDTEGNS